MSTIDKMLIKGIRSFSPDNGTVIAFYKPLTLIVGPNGAGKTTIIECLKHACTGDLPPNARSGHSFIHDPKVEGESETRGQIKLRFKTASGKHVVCVRSFMLTQKASKLEYKAIESVLQTVDAASGETKCLSYRCADMDREVPALMGVSKAILENVIFVHQDDANWPLAEGALQESMEGDKQKAAELKARIRDLDGRIAEGRARMGAAEAALKEVRRQEKDVEVLQSKREVLVRQKTQQFHDLQEESTESDEDLSKWLADFEKSLGRIKVNVKLAEQQLNDAQLQNEAQKELYSRDCTLKGRLQAEADAHADDTRQRDRCLQTLYSKHGLGQLEALPLSSKAAARGSRRATQHLEELHLSWQQLKDENAGKDNKLTKLIEEAKARLLEVQGDIRQMAKQKAASKEKEQQLSKSISVSAVSEVDARRLDEEEKSAMLAAMTSPSRVTFSAYMGPARVDQQTDAAQLKEKEYEKQVEEARTRVYSLERRIRNLQDEKDGLASEAGDRVKLRLKQEGLANKELSMNSLLEESRAAYMEVMGGKRLDPKTMLHEIQRTVALRKQALDEVEPRASSARMEVAALTMRAEDARKDLAFKQRDCDEKGSLLARRLFDAAQQQLEVDALEEQLQKARLDVESNQHCVTSGSIRSRAEAAAARQEWTAVMPTGVLQHVAGELAAAKTKHEQACQVEAVARDVDRLWNEGEALKREVEDQEHKLNILSQGMRTVAVVSAELSDLDTERMEKLQEEQQRRSNEAQTCNMRWRNAREAHSEVKHKIHAVNAMKQERKQLVQDLEKLDLDAKAAEERLEPLAHEQQRLVGEREALRQAAHAEENRRQEQLRALQRDVDQLKAISTKIEQYAASGKDAKLRETADRMAASLAAQAVHEARIAELSSQLAESQVKIQNQSGVKRNLEDNLNYRATVREEQALAAQIARLQEQLVAYGDIPTLEKELRDLSLEVESSVAEQNRSGGTVAAYVSSMARSRAELRAPQYKDINNRHRSQLIQLKPFTFICQRRSQLAGMVVVVVVVVTTTEMANKDLDKYYNALDRALMRFHSMKMEEINKIIKELWQQTYRGQDIDFIEIRSDAEGAGTRSYSYRVVMRSGDAELDMRGRCSAGQKVLASLVIRLALAETFCLNCGILALDEPTTNLDTPNAESLAAALLRIMEDRKGQENFQLIVITHDEKFAELIGKKQHAEHYYRISKDDQYAP
eukprot:jgi/Mesen1/8356/ME000463S07798